MKVVKVVNNNNLCVLDDNGHEQIVSGKGIGFGKKYGDPVDQNEIQKTYLITDSKLQEKMISLLKEIPEEHMNLANEIVEYIKKGYPAKLNDSLLITLSDHISFAIERKQKGIEFTNPLLDSIEASYPEALKMGEYGVERINEAFGLSMTRDEAGFIAMHIINAQLDTKMSEVYDITKMINGCLETAEFTLQMKFDKSSESYKTFVDYLKYLSPRLLLRRSLPEGLDKDRIFVKMLKKTCHEQYLCAEKIQEYMMKTFQINISEDILLTLTIHLKRLSANK